MLRREQAEGFQDEKSHVESLSLSLAIADFTEKPMVLQLHEHGRIPWERGS
jgi:hypothetical protein